MRLNNFQRYYPENNSGVPIAYLQSDSGADWYDSQKLFSDDTWKIVFDSDGVIVSFSNDISMLFPVGMSVAEVDDIPDGVDINGGWMFDGEFITPVPEGADTAAQRKTALMSVATAVIAPLQDADDMDIATDEEREALLLWKKYRVLLSRVDVSKAPNIKWPEVPENVA
ncbi:tail fiber assembly protein [Pseudocitrobacter vendiensis]|uniref:Tail fiber assembly protein n=1 Tax=Pseudocitrobacter vendiensis TaxID=2488306 RepID=A0ABM9FCS1_9ENTR|nr:tail fiber assembly protein [Pseudocitrobacter vendiensis]CAH6661000.1 Tail fiber assembly protein [Pseudocitrobacter vendiensis]